MAPNHLPNFHFALGKVKGCGDDDFGVDRANFSEPIFHLLPNQEPDWLGIWIRLRVFAILTGMVVIWILVFSIFRYEAIKRIKSTHHHPSKTDLNRLTAAFGLSLADIEGWQDLRCVDVYIDQNGRIEQVKPLDEKITNP